MSRLFRSRLFVVLAFLLVVACIGSGVWRYGYVQALGNLARQSEADLTLASDRLTSQLSRHRQLAVLMAEHPVIAKLSAGVEPREVQRLLQSVADKTSALDVMYMDIDGFVRVAAREGALRNLAQEPYSIRAMQGALGLGIGTYWPTKERAFFFAAPHFGAGGKVRGAVVVAANVAEIEWDWTGSNPAVFFTDAAGIVHITNRSELTFWRQSPAQDGFVPPKGPARPFQALDVNGHEVWRLDWGPYLPRRALHVERDLPVIGMRGEALVDVAPALRLAGLQAAAISGLCLAFGAVVLLLTERRRTLAEANAQLGARVAERTAALSSTNLALRREVSEREDAEAALRRAQAELVQAGKLSALGQMSAGISHELNQPLMAIQSFAENGAAYLERDRPEQARDNLTRIGELANRMGRIIRNLRAFARQESAPVSRVDLVAVLDSAVDLTSERLASSDVTLVYDRPLHPIWVRGGEVRLGQVFVNLISNAADAMAGAKTRVLTLAIHAEDPLSVSVADTGPGIDVPDKVFEPFYSTKAASAQDGMGLGLSISYGIVQSFGGDIRGANSETGGAVFTVELTRWQEEQAA